ncbi:MAG: DUF1223 domain-containing protein [Caulobacteraceae bacterium]
MRKAALVLAMCALWIAPGAALARRPVLVELYTAQGCSSCAQANQFIDRIADRPGVVALTFAVDYWDYLGWKDTFAQAAFTDRQRTYDDRFGLRDVYTPQVIVDGAAQASGDKAAAVETLIREARRRPGEAPQMKIMANGRVAVGSGPRPRGGAEVWLVRYDPREQQVAVRNGDNRGKTVLQRNVVRQLARLGSWKGRPAVYRPPPAPEDDLETLVLLQGADGGKIVGLLRRPQ